MIDQLEKFLNLKTNWIRLTRYYNLQVSKTNHFVNFFVFYTFKNKSFIVQVNIRLINTAVSHTH